MKVCTAPYLGEENEDGNYSGHAMKRCVHRDDGTLWIDNGEYASRVRYCPVCGAREGMSEREQAEHDQRETELAAKRIGAKIIWEPPARN